MFGLKPTGLGAEDLVMTDIDAETWARILRAVPNDQRAINAEVARLRAMNPGC